jgi:hypothetical protein
MGINIDPTKKQSRRLAELLAFSIMGASTSNQTGCPAGDDENDVMCLRVYSFWRGSIALQCGAVNRELILGSSITTFVTLQH